MSWGMRIMDFKETYNKIAEDWYRDHKQDTWWVDGTDEFIALLKLGSLVLYVGCGAGVKSKYLISRGLKVVGIDFSEKMVEIARREVPEGKFQVMDVKETRSIEEGFDGIFLQAVLLHLKKNEVVSVLQSLLGKLKKGGYMYIAVKEKKLEGPDEEIKKEEDYGYSYERFFSYFTMDEIKEYVEKLGMNLKYESITASGNTQWIQVIAQK